MNFVARYIIPILLTIVLFLAVALGGAMFHIYILSNKLDKANVNLGVVAAMSQQHEVKVVESAKVVQQVKWKTNDRILKVKEYVYDENKSDCDNAIDSMRTVF